MKYDREEIMSCLMEILSFTNPDCPISLMEICRVMKYIDRPISNTTAKKYIHMLRSDNRLNYVQSEHRYYYIISCRKGYYVTKDYEIAFEFKKRIVAQMNSLSEILTHLTPQL